MICPECCEKWQRVQTLRKLLQAVLSIMKTCLYNVDPLKRHFYIVKLGFTGVYIISEFLSENFKFLVVKFLIYLNRHASVMCIYMVCSGMFVQMIS